MSIGPTATPSHSVPASHSATQTPVVVDLAYGDVVVDAAGRRERFDVTYLLDHIDSTFVTVDDVPRPAEEVWREALRAVVRHAGPAPLVIGHPSTWGSVRRGVLARAAAATGVPVTLLPRAVLVARSHSDTVMGNCVVVETTHRPCYPGTTPGAWDVQRMLRTSTGWMVERSGVLTLGEDAEMGEQIVALIDDSVEAVFVDGADPAEVQNAIEQICVYAVAGRVVAVDRSLLRRHGARTTVVAPLPDVVVSASPDPTARPSWLRRHRVSVAAAAAIVTGLAVLGVVGWRHDGSAGTVYRDAAVGRTTLSAPASWRESPLPVPGDPDDRGTSRTRTVFTDPATGGRILLVQSDVRSASTLESVARSLGNRITQRGDEVVSEFSASTTFGGREVIAYREAPASGSAIRWYVLVDDDLQVSVGCQAGSTGEPVDAECARAVSTVQIAEE